MRRRKVTTKGALPQLRQHSRLAVQTVQGFSANCHSSKETVQSWNQSSGGLIKPCTRERAQAASD